jgi:hypothetical protein
MHRLGSGCTQSQALASQRFAQFARGAFPSSSSTLLARAGADAPGGQLRWMHALPKTIQHYLARWQAEWTDESLAQDTLVMSWGVGAKTAPLQFSSSARTLLKKIKKEIQTLI